MNRPAETSAPKIQSLSYLNKAQREIFLDSLTPEQRRHLQYDWRLWARPAQISPPEDEEWFGWLILGGRGAGKTRAGAEWIREQTRTKQRIALVAETAADFRDTMIQGESGLIAIAPKDDRPIYYPTKRRVEWPNGAFALLFSAEDPDQVRGGQFEVAWCDEIAKWQYLDDTWSNLMFSLRLGRTPRFVATSTPRPLPLIKSLVTDPFVRVSRESSYANRANLTEFFYSTVIKRYEGTRLGRQELHAEILSDVLGAIFSSDDIDKARTQTPPPKDQVARIVIGVDPSIAANDNLDDTDTKHAECGIVAACTYIDPRYTARDPHRWHFALLADESARLSPHGWATRAIALYHRVKADRIVAEVNQGGALVEETLRQVDPNVPITLVHASKGKQARAEPIAAIMEQHRVHHVGIFPELESQMTTWVPGEPSPDRLDAYVWAMTALLETASTPGMLDYYTRLHDNLNAIPTHPTVLSPRGQPAKN